MATDPAEEQDDASEQSYTRGRRMAYLSMLTECLKGLGINDPAAEHLKWVHERELTVSYLRELCGEYGDNDWPENLALCDVLRKHLEPYL